MGSKTARSYDKEFREQIPKEGKQINIMWLQKSIKFQQQQYIPGYKEIKTDLKPKN